MERLNVNSSLRILNQPPAETAALTALVAAQAQCDRVAGLIGPESWPTREVSAPANRSVITGVGSVRWLESLIAVDRVVGGCREKGWV